MTISRHQCQNNRTANQISPIKAQMLRNRQQQHIKQNHRSPHQQILNRMQAFFIQNLNKEKSQKGDKNK